MCESRGKDAVSELAQLRVAALGVLQRLVDEPLRRSFSARERTLSQLQRHDRMDQPLLRAVVEVAHDAPPCLIRLGEQTRSEAVSWSRLSAFAIAVPSSSANCTIRSSVSAGGACSRRHWETVRPQSRPSTMIGAPTVERTPMSRTSSAIWPALSW